MASAFTTLGASRMLSVFCNTGAVTAKSFYLMLLKEGWMNKVSTPRTHTLAPAASTTDTEWTYYEPTFTGYGSSRKQVTSFTTPTNDVTVEALKNDSAITWTTSAVTSTVMISGAALVDQALVASGSPAANVFAFTTFDMSVAMGGSIGQTLTLPANSFFMQLG